MPAKSSEIKSTPNRWFRFYAESLDDPKVQKLPPHLFKTWVNILSFACRNGGTFRRDEIAFALRLGEHDAGAQIDELVGLALIDIRADAKLEPHNWRERQFVSDVSTSRVRKHRKRKENRAEERNVSLAVPSTVSETPPDTETDTDNPLTPNGGSDGNSDSAMPSHVRPIANWSTAFAQPAADPSHASVIRSESGAITLVNGTRALWLEKFGNDAERLDLALIEIAGQINAGSRKGLAADVQSRLARIAGAKRDSDQRYRDAAKANIGRTRPALAEPIHRVSPETVRYAKPRLEATDA